MREAEAERASAEALAAMESTRLQIDALEVGAVTTHRARVHPVLFSPCMPA